MPRCYASRHLSELPLQPEIHSSPSFPPFGSRFKDHLAQLAFFERCYGLSFLADRATQLVNCIGDVKLCPWLRLWPCRSFEIFPTAARIRRSTASVFHARRSTSFCAALIMSLWNSTSCSAKASRLPSATAARIAAI